MPALRLFGIITAFLLLSVKINASVPDNKKLRYVIKNLTKENISELIQLESYDSEFANSDTVATIEEVKEGPLLITSKNNVFKPFQKTIIKTSKGYCSTKVFQISNLCDGYELVLQKSGATVTVTNYFRVTRIIMQIAVVTIVTFFIRGLIILVMSHNLTKQTITYFLCTNIIALVVFFMCFVYSRDVLNIYTITLPILCFITIDTLYKYRTINRYVIIQRIFLSSAASLVWLVTIIGLSFVFLFSEC